MKKVFALIAIVGLVSCGGEAKVETPAADTTVAPAPDTTVAPVAPDTTATAAPVAAPASH